VISIRDARLYKYTLIFIFICIYKPVNALQLVELNEENLLVVELGVASFKLAETLFVFQQPETTLLPLQELVDALDFPLNIDVAAGTVDGWFVKESNTFSIDIEQQTLFIRGQQKAWPKALYYAVDDFDLYFDYRLLERWFGLELNLNISQLSLLISSDVELPIIKQRKRHEKRESLVKGQAQAPAKEYLPNEYQYLGNPLFDLELSEDLLHHRGHFQQFTGGVLQGRMDLMKHSMRSSYIYADGQEDLRLTFSRSASGPDTDMYLGLRSYEFGDLNTGSDSLVYDAVEGRGLALSRGTSTSLDKVDDVLLEGDAPPGWEVELYRNGSLVAFTDSGSDGRYSFSDIATFVGQNIFDIRIYGPQWQYRTRKEKINIGPGMIKKNEWGSRLQVIESKTPLISLNGEDSDEGVDSNFFMGELTYGLNDYLTLQTSLVELRPENSENTHFYRSIDAFTSLAGAFIHLTWVDDTESGHAYAAVVKGNWSGVNFNIDALKFNNLVSDQNPNNTKRGELKLGINGVTRAFFSTPMTYDFEINDTEFRGSLKRQTSYQNRMSFNLFSANIAHDLRYTTYSQDEDNDDSVDEIDALLDANLSVNKRFYQWRLKAGLDYSISPKGRINGLVSSASWKKTSRFMYQAQVNYAFSEDAELSLNNTFTWSFDDLDLSLNAGFTNNGMQALGLSLNTAFAYDPKRQQLSISNDFISSTGTVTAKAYLDRNNDGQFNDGDQALEGVTFKGRSAWRKMPTDSTGLVTLKGIPPQELQIIEIDEGSLGDPFLRVKNAKRFVYTHAGATNDLEFSVLETFEIEGSIDIVRQGRSSIRSGIPVQVRTAGGEIVAESSTEYDGVFIVERMVPGAYHITVAESFLKRHELVMSAPVHLLTQGGEGVVYLDTISLNGVNHSN